MFNIKKALSGVEEMYNYEFFDDPEALLLDDNYNEYKEDGTVKNKNASIIYFPSVHSGNARI